MLFYVKFMQMYFTTGFHEFYKPQISWQEEHWELYIQDS